MPVKVSRPPGHRKGFSDLSGEPFCSFRPESHGEPSRFERERQIAIRAADGYDERCVERLAVIVATLGTDEVVHGVVHLRRHDVTPVCRLYGTPGSDLFDVLDFGTARPHRGFDRALERRGRHRAAAAGPDHLHERDRLFDADEPDVAPVAHDAGPNLIEGGTYACVERRRVNHAPQTPFEPAFVSSPSEQDARPGDAENRFHKVEA